MKKLAKIWEILVWACVVALNLVNRLVPYPFSVVVCIALLLVNIAYIIFCYRTKAGVADNKRIIQVIEIFCLIIIPIGYIIIAFMYNIKGENPLVW
ncbi:MAG: hypothetical protein IJ447_06515 [Clostridia bacterium]|nr:hypothetical protein [Clostridia bacterium]